MDVVTLRSAAARLLVQAGLHDQFELRPLSGGANNRVFLIEAGQTQALLKAYFQHARDPRDRLGAEFAFARFAWEQGIRALPKPLACDRVNRLGLFEFVEGQPVRPGAVDEDAVRQALAFYRALNRHRELDTARRLPCASEACFSLADHVRCVDGRVRSLEKIEPTSAIDRDAVAFIRGDLPKVWADVIESLREAADKLGPSLELPLDCRDWRVSPSDFGFHNAVRTADGSLCFFDFEYAGWDDPARMVCDFFCQPAVPVPGEHLELFAEAVSDYGANRDGTRQRIDRLFPVYRIKWCCILLNEFLSAGEERRRFAGSEEDSGARKANQLAKARRSLEETMSATSARAERHGIDVLGRESMTR